MKINIIALVIVLIIVGCSKEPEPFVPRTIADVRSDLNGIELKQGDNDITLEFLNNVFWDFRIVAPQMVENVSYPLIVDLHGASGGNPNAHKNTECYIEPALEGREAFVLSPNGGESLWHSFINQEKVLILLELLKERWPITTEKIAITGYSNGGNGSWFFGETQPTVFSAAIPIASSYTTVSTDGTARKMPIPMYVIHGEDDDLFPVQQTQDWVSLSITEGSEITLEIAPGLTHNEPCSYVPFVTNAINWLFDEVWN